MSTNEDQGPDTELWVFQQRGGGFSRFAFFGCTARDVSLQEGGKLGRIATTVTSRDGEITVFLRGIFHVTPEG